MLVDIYFSSIFRLACSQSTGAGLSKTYSKRKGQKHKIRPCKFQLACSSLESQLLASLLSRIKAAQPYNLLLRHGVLVLHSRSRRRPRHWPLTPAAFLASHSGSKCLKFTSLFSRFFRSIATLSISVSGKNISRGIQQAAALASNSNTGGLPTVTQRFQMSKIHQLVFI